MSHAFYKTLFPYNGDLNTYCYRVNPKLEYFAFSEGLLSCINMCIKMKMIDVFLEMTSQGITNRQSKHS